MQTAVCAREAPPPPRRSQRCFPDHTETTPAAHLTTCTAQATACLRGIGSTPNPRIFPPQRTSGATRATWLASLPCPAPSSSRSPSPRRGSTSAGSCATTASTCSATRDGVRRSSWPRSPRAVIERSQAHAERALAGRAPLPLCESCRWPARAAREDAEARRFVEDLGDSARELAGAVAALR
jgi:hypothetical protein